MDNNKASLDENLLRKPNIHGIDLYELRNAAHILLENSVYHNGNCMPKIILWDMPQAIL